MKKYKGLIIFSAILVVYAIVMYIVFNDNNKVIVKNNEDTNTSEKNQTYYLVINNYANYKYQNNKFTIVKNKTIESLDELKVYVNNKYYGNYTLKYGNKWNLLNSKGEFVNYSGNILAFSKDFNINVKDIKIRSINDEEKFDIISNYKISSFNYLTNNQVIETDLNNDGNNDKIICLSSMEESNNINNYYNLVVVNINDSYQTIIEEKGQNANYVYEILSVLNILNSNSDTIIISRVEGLLSESPNYNILMANYENEKYTID